MKQSPSLLDRLDQAVFDAIYARSLVYNTCWEDPAVDRQALQLSPDDNVLVITSAGCNALDYALAGAGCIHAVDANPRQTALLELKLAGIRRLDYEDFFRIFGDGRHPEFARLLRDALRPELSAFARDFWERNADWLGHNDPRRSFYYHGLSGVVARAFRLFLRLRPNLAVAVHQLLEAPCVEVQRYIYDQAVHPHLWSPGMNWALSRQLTMSLLGVPHPQRKEVERQHQFGVPGFIREAIEYVFRQLPIADNYFWNLYLRGRYRRACCPEYLKPDNFEALKRGLVERIHPHTCTVTRFLQHTQERFSRFVLLDHMDWMSSYQPEALAEEWNVILSHATDNARVLFRSAHVRPRYLDNIEVNHGERGRLLPQVLRFDHALSDRLQREDRVHTYAGLHIADVMA